MFRFSSRVPGLGAVVAFSIMFTVVGHAQEANASDAPSAPVLTPATVDVYGIKLGMTPAQVIAALKAYAPDMAITDNTGNMPKNMGQTFWDSNLTIFGLSGDFPRSAAIKKKLDDETNACNQESINENEAKHGGMVDPEIARESAHNECDQQLPPNRYAPAFHAALNVPQVIAVWFSPVPGDEKVIAVSSSTWFYKNVPLVTDAVAAVKNKFKVPPSVDRPTTSYANAPQLLGWLFDARSRLESARVGRQAERLSTTSKDCSFALDDSQANIFCPDLEMPTTVAKSDGVRLLVDVDGGATMEGTTGRASMGAMEGDTDGLPPNPLLTQYLNMLLYDSAAIYKYDEQTAHYAASVQQQQNQQTTSQFQGNAPKL